MAEENPARQSAPGIAGTIIPVLVRAWEGHEDGEVNWMPRQRRSSVWSGGGATAPGRQANLMRDAWQKGAAEVGCCPL